MKSGPQGNQILKTHYYQAKHYNCNGNDDNVLWLAGKMWARIIVVTPTILNHPHTENLPTNINLAVHICKATHIPDIHEQDIHKKQHLVHEDKHFFLTN